MDPPPSYTEAFPLKEEDEALPPHPPGPPMVPYTTVNMSRERPPRDHIIWSLLSFLIFPPCCLGLAAVIYSFKARDSKMLGDYRSAHGYGTTARNINMALIVLFLILVTVTIFLAFYNPYWAQIIGSAVSSKWI